MDKQIDISQVTLETDRLILRAWKESDLNDFFEYASVPGVGEMAGWPHHENIETSKEILDSFISGKNVFALVYKENNKVIGSLGLHNSWANEEENYKNLYAKEIGYVLSKDYWGMGLMPEAVKAVIDFCFNDCGIAVLSCGHFESNPQSRRVIEKSGFTFVKKSQYHAKSLGKTFDDMRYVLLAPSLGNPNNP